MDDCSRSTADTVEITGCCTVEGENELADEIWSLANFDPQSFSLEERTTVSRTQQRTMLDGWKGMVSLPEYILNNSRLIRDMGNDYQCGSTRNKVKVLLYKPDIDRLMKFIAKAVMESNRCKFFPADKGEQEYELLQKAYAVLGCQMGTREWDLMPLRYFCDIIHIIGIWCPGISDFAMRIHSPANCYYSLGNLVDDVPEEEV